MKSKDKFFQNRDDDENDYYYISPDILLSFEEVEEKEESGKEEDNNEEVEKKPKERKYHPKRADIYAIAIFMIDLMTLGDFHSKIRENTYNGNIKSYINAMIYNFKEHSPSKESYKLCWELVRLIVIAKEKERYHEIHKVLHYLNQKRTPDYVEDDKILLLINKKFNLQVNNVYMDTIIKKAKLYFKLKLNSVCDQFIKNVFAH